MHECGKLSYGASQRICKRTCFTENRELYLRPLKSGNVGRLSEHSKICYAVGDPVLPFWALGDGMLAMNVVEGSDAVDEALRGLASWMSIVFHCVLESKLIYLYKVKTHGELLKLNKCRL